MMRPSGCAALLAVGLALAPVWASRSRAQDRVPGPEVAGTLSVQFTDKLLRAPGWEEKLDRVVELGAAFVRVDLNWPWVEVGPGRYDWSAYDAFAAAMRARKLRPLFILNRPNRIHGRSLSAGEAAPPRGASEVAAFARWAAAAAVRYRDADPIWEIWNEPDARGFWPPAPEPPAYVALARAACLAIKAAVPTAVVTGPAAAEMPTVWDGRKPLVAAVLRDSELTRCLDAISLHTHRFGQEPETVGRDYAVYRRAAAALPGASLPILDTEWGDSVHRGGLSEERQARWLPRMVLTNLAEAVSLTNWYCLFDTGDDDGEIEDRFGLIARDGRRRPAFRAYQVLARELRGHSLRRVIARFDVESARGTTVLLFCDAAERCKLAAWTTDDQTAPESLTIPGWTLAGSIVGHLGARLAALPQRPSSVTLAVSPEVQFAPVRPAGAGN
jgi:polysaccharide biosynthesis protein PslG